MKDICMFLLMLIILVCVCDSRDITMAKLDDIYKTVQHCK
jgi:hypothetical protein